MRSQLSRQFGSTNWAFIITLILLLVFVWLWYDESDKQDQMTQQLQTAEQKARDLNSEALKLAEGWEDLSKAVGWRSGTFRFSAVTGPKAEIITTDAGLVRANASRDGVVPGGEEGATKDGLLKQIIAAAQLSFDRTARLHTTKTGDETEYTFSTLSTAFKDKLAEVKRKYEDVLTVPVGPSDPDDVDGMARLASEKQDYERKVGEYHAALKELTAMEGWSEFNARIRAPGTWGDPNAVGVKVTYYRYTDLGESTLQAAVEDLPTAFIRMRQEIAAYIDAANELARQLKADGTAKEEALTQANAALQTEQEAHTNDVTQLQTQLTDANEGRNRNMIEKTNAEQALAKVRDESGKTEIGLKREIEARKEQNRLLKEKRDLVVQRDDPDGTVLVSNQILRTATIDLGHADKAYVGQKFLVSAIDRGGNRVNKGEVVIVRISGAHAAQVRIVSGGVGDGDRLHNPFYQRGERIYVYLAATLDKWPKELARARLAKLNVVVQDAMDGDTHYVVVPNSWVAATPKPAGEDGEESEEGAVANPLEEIQKKARIFGANVITERMLDAFLDY